MIITFCGHSQVIFTDEEKSVLRNILVDEINKNEKNALKNFFTI